NFDNPVYRKT
nr:Chain B, Apolipoprotein E Receptor-2 peptide [synthetic construct]1NU2_B Chain B, peptide derived from murine Apolipoprotein E Receptor-2 [synthetic construct]